MISRAITLVAGVLSFLLSGCASIPKSEYRGGLFLHTAPKYSFQVPDGWRRAMASDSALVGFNQRVFLRLNENGRRALMQIGEREIANNETWTRERLGPTKTRQSRLVSFLHPVLDDSEEWRSGATEQGRVVLHALRGAKVRSLDPAVFVFGHGDRPVGSMELHRAWKRVLVAAKVRYRSPEQLRHTFASTMLSRNAPLLYVQQQGGWRSATVLLRVYARWMPQDGASRQPSATYPQPEAAAAAIRGPVSAS